MKIIIVAAAAGLSGLGIGLSITAPQAADEIRCRVNAEALIRDLALLARPVDADELRRLLEPKTR